MVFGGAECVMRRLFRLLDALGDHSFHTMSVALLSKLLSKLPLLKINTFLVLHAVLLTTSLRRPGLGINALGCYR